jgi:hypothetical protein
MRKRTILVIAFAILVSCLVFAQEQGTFGKIELGKDGFVYQGEKFSSLLLYSGGLNVNLHSSYKDFLEISNYQNGSDTILVFKMKNQVFEFPVSVISSITYNPGKFIYLRAK